MNDNVTSGHAKVTQVGSEENVQSGDQVFPLSKNSQCHVKRTLSCSLTVKYQMELSVCSNRSKMIMKSKVIITFVSPNVCTVSILNT